MRLLAPITLLLVTTFVWPAHGASRALAAKLDPRLAGALAADAAPEPVWVEFTDKGEAGPGDLVARLAAAEAALTPKARARRERAHMQPLVDYLDLPLEPAYVAAIRARGLQPYGQSRWFNRVAVRAAGAQLEALAALACVRHLAPVERASLQRDPAPTLGQALIARPLGSTAAEGPPSFYGQTYTQMLRLGVPAVHDSGYIGTGMLICMLDEGYNYYQKHSATRSLPILTVRDFVQGDSTVTDTVVDPGIYHHGEWTLSTIGGDLPGIYIGPAYGATYMLGRTEDSGSEKPIEMTNWAMGAEWADSAGADVISSSLGYDVFDSPYPPITYSMLDGHTTVITRAAEIAASRGILVVNSAGNSGFRISAPADADSIITSGAVDSLGVHASYSAMGPTADGRLKPELVAQGSSVLVAAPDLGGNANAYNRLNGTSFSCPLTAGLAACLLQARPSWTATKLIQVMRETASRATHPDTVYGWGIPNGLAVLRWSPDTAGVPLLPGSGLAFTLAGPNPLRSDGAPTHLRFALEAGTAPARGRVRVYDALGRQLSELWSGDLVPAVVIDVPWSGEDAAGRALRSGLYFLSFEAAGRRAVRRVVTLR